MRHLPLLLLGFLVFGGAAAFAGDLAFALRADPAEVDFGQAGQHQVRESKVRLINDGRESVVISSVSTDCGCTTVLLSKTTLPPGEDAVLTITLEPREKSGGVRRMVIVHASSGDLAIPVRIAIVPAQSS